MDDEDTPKPEVVFKQRNFFQTKKGITLLTTFGGILFFVILVISLNYFDIISPVQLSSLPKKPVNYSATGTPLKITLVPENYGFKAGDLTLNCPVESSFCPSQKLTNIEQKDTVSYKAASGSAVSNLTPPSSLENIAVTTKKDGKKYFYESVVAKDGTSCFTIAYTLPQDATFTNILDIGSLLKNQKVATLGSDTFQVGGTDANVLVQIRNTPMDPGTPCSLIKKSPAFFNNF